MKRLTSESVAAAARFVDLNARLIDRHRLAFHLAGGAKEPVLAALRAYVNLDGGFGNALEPDLRGAGSQPQPVEVALRILDELDAFDDPMVTAACDYLQTITTTEGGVPFVLPSVRDTPRAPWWQTGDDPEASLNPTAALAGLLHKHGVDHPWLAPATEFCWSRLTGITEFDHMYTGLAALTFLANVPDRERAGKMIETLREPLLAALDEGGIPSRGLHTAERLDAVLDEMVDAQRDDGGWPVGFFVWTPVNTYEWRGAITVGNLVTLAAYDRLP